MNRKKSALLALFLGAAAAAAVSAQPYGYTPPDAYASPSYRYEPARDDERPNVDVGFFYSELAPYGHWVRHPSYGWVWFPRNVQAGWRPYRDGRWVASDFGWTWASYEPFGWATYHYGRWAWDPQLGWIWIPGTAWGPAWVAWQHGDGYVGWAPLPPQVGFQVGVGLRLGGVDLAAYLQPFTYTFVPERVFLDTRIDRYALPSARNVSILPRTRSFTRYSVAGTRVVNVGVPVESIERVTRQSVRRVRLVSSWDRVARVDRNEMRMYQPPATALRTVRVAERNNRGLAQSSQDARPHAGPIQASTPRQGTSSHTVNRNSRPATVAVVQRPEPPKPRVLEREEHKQTRQLTRYQEKQAQRLTEIQKREMQTAERSTARAAQLGERQKAEIAALKAQQHRQTIQLQNRMAVERQAVKATPSAQLRTASHRNDKKPPEQGRRARPRPKQASPRNGQ